LNKQDNRQRWPDLAKAVDNLRAVFGEVSVMTVYEGDKLVAGREIKRNLVQPHIDGMEEYLRNASERPQKRRRATIKEKR